MKKFTIRKLSDFGWSVIAPNQNLYTDKPLAESEAQSVCDNLNATIVDSITIKLDL